MRRPEDKRVKDWDNKACEPDRLFCAVSESMLVFKVNAMFEAPNKVDVHRPVIRPLLCVLFTHRAGGPVTHAEGLSEVSAGFLRKKD
jgi:hypothetical protein